jgi:hypothetical protein
MEKPSTIHNPSCPLEKEWRQEVAIMRCGADLDWLAWNSACRSRWAASFLGLADDHGIAVAAEDRAWLESLAKEYQE